MKKDTRHHQQKLGNGTRAQRPDQPQTASRRLTIP